MTDYKQAFEELYKAVTKTGNEETRLQALNIKEQLLERQQITPDTKKSNVTKEEFANMDYRERVEFKAEYPEEYNSMIGGR